MTATTFRDPDLDTIARARAGDSRAFARLVDAYQTPIYNLCCRLLANSHEAEEATQETFLRVFTKIASHDPSRSFKTWAFSIAHHYCIDRLRRRRMIWVSLDDEPESDVISLPSNTPSPEDVAMRREKASDVQALLNSLPPQYRSAVVMRYWYDLSYEEIAQASDSSVSAVKSRLHRARGALADMVSAAERAPRPWLPLPAYAPGTPACHLM